MRRRLALVTLVAIVALTLIQFGPQVIFGNEPINPSYARAGAR